MLYVIGSNCQSHAIVLPVEKGLHVLKLPDMNIMWYLFISIIIRAFSVDWLDVKGLIIICMLTAF